MDRNDVLNREITRRLTMRQAPIINRWRARMEYGIAGVAAAAWATVLLQIIT